MKFKINIVKQGNPDPNSYLWQGYLVEFTSKERKYMGIVGEDHLYPAPLTVRYLKYCNEKEKWIEYEEFQDMENPTRI